MKGQIDTSLSVDRPRIPMGASYFPKDIMVFPKAYVPAVPSLEDSDGHVVAGFGETTGLSPNSIMRVEDTLLRMKRRKCWRMICVGCLEEVEVPTVLSQERTDMPESC